ncbi:MAG: hypothetical protein HKO53_01690, partial [Gemmatimonadetes bacterium]|nr:hypothetical protein [Gemmatimonadota bacterium]
MKPWAAWLLLMVVGCSAQGSDPNLLTLWGDFEPKEQALVERHVEWFREFHPEVTVDLIYL